ncbi:PilW family protein [Marinobacter halotolerans]|uniref:PilW family protein n=1 Tax=Marinobacter halotolerans TaxID=1569211 RepID=UPI00177E73D8|nr:PilW family protein [Marinobacter halotolerans]
MIKQQGLSLIELMIAMTLGLILTFGVVQIFISSKQTYSVVTAQSQTQENGRVVKHFLGRGLRHAGYWDDSTLPIALPDNGVFAENQMVFATNDDAASANNIVDGTDTITVRFNGTADGQLRGCTGMTPDRNQMIVDRYYVTPAGANTNVPSLQCDSEMLTLGGASVSTASQPLIVGIENLQVEFGIGTEDRITQYVSADEVTDWGDVRSVRYGFLATSNQNTGGRENTNTYTLVDGETVTASGDNRLRQVQRDTVFLRNFRG